MKSLRTYISENFERLSYLTILLFSASAILPFIVACFYIHPNADDWWFAAQLNDLGRWGFITDFYNDWSGRYFSNILIAIPKADMVQTPWMYRVLPIIFILLTGIIIHSFVHRLMTQNCL